MVEEPPVPPIEVVAEQEKLKLKKKLNGRKSQIQETELVQPVSLSESVLMWFIDGPELWFCVKCCLAMPSARLVGFDCKFYFFCLWLKH